MADRPAAVELVLRLYPALATGDRETLDALLHEDFVGETTHGLPLEAGDHHDGPAAMRRFWGVIARTYDVHAEPREAVELSDGRVLVTGTYIGTARATGRKLEAAFTHTLAVRDGRIAGLVQVTDSAAWAAALEEPPYTTLHLDIDDGLAVLRLDRPAAGNAIDVAMTDDLRAAAERLTGDPSVRALVIVGSGPRLSVGGDIALFAQTPPEELSPLLDSMIGSYHIALRLLADLPIPVVCGVHGGVGGGALGFLYAADLVLAADDVRIALGFSRLGLSMDGANTWYLPRLVGHLRAAKLYLDNDVVDAERALDLGLVSEVVPAAELEARALGAGRRLAAGPTVAYANARRLLRRSWEQSLDQQLADERRTMTAVARTRDAAEGVAAFTARRTPDFTGT